MSPTATTTAASLVLYCISGTLLTLANKLAVVALPAPNALLVFQNGVTVLLLLTLTRVAPERVGGALPPLTVAAVRTWLPLTLLFVGMLASSLLALLQVSAVTLIVFRNLGTLVTAFFERAVLGTEISTLSVASLLGILLGVLLYAYHDLQFSAVGYAWLTLNVACTAAFQIYVKGLISAMPKEGPGALGPFGMSYYNNAISLPVFALVAACSGELPRLPSLVGALSARGWTFVVASAVLGFALSTSAFLVNKLVSATSMMVANNVNKFALIILSEVFVQATLGPLAAFGTALVVVFAWLYAQSKGPWASIGYSHVICSPRHIVVFSAILTCVIISCGIGGRNLLRFVAGVESCPPSSVLHPEPTALNLNHFAAFIPLRVGPRWAPQPGIRSDNESVFYFRPTDWAACPRAAGEPGFKRLCNEKGGACAAPLAAVSEDVPLKTAAGELVQHAIQRTLRAAWGDDPPKIDFYVRSGCMGATELQFLLPSLDLFWPDFLGEILIVLDAGNHASLEQFLPRNWRSTRHSYRFVYEDVPCLPGRLLNQVSYLNMDLHSNAQYITSIDSDCTLHSPVTPDVLLRRAGC
jgi:drug/metabolite transporter (DMT)-like permease